MKILCSILVLQILAGARSPAETVNSAAVKKLLAAPPTEYSTGPLWVWNDLLTDADVVRTLRDLAAQDVKQVFVHPRPGLITPYLSRDWFHLWKTTLTEAKRLDMAVWIYDENSYPSGFAGGEVPETMPESRGVGLRLRESAQWTTNALAIFQRQGDQFEKITNTGGARTGPFWTATIQPAQNSPWHGGRSYVDLLRPGVTEKFLELTHERYRRELGDEFGKTIPGVFTDEPNIRPAGGLPWTPGLPALFEKRWGYSLVDALPSLALETGDWRKVRHNYFQLLSEQFVEHWAKPYHDYCARYGLQMTGHYWEHEWPNALGVPDNMAMYAWEQRPAIDTLMNQYATGPHAQFGNARAAKELSSVANQLGLPRTLCEVYGAGGWDLRFEDMKRIGDWLEVLGVNTLNQHLSYISLRGARKRDHPQSFSYHEPWWEAYHVSARYLARISAALSQGRQANRILLLEPTTTAWMYNSESENSSRLREIGDSFQRLVNELEAAQVEYDIGCEDIAARHGKVHGKELQIGRASYETVVVGPNTENFNRATVSLLEQFKEAGGDVLFVDAAPNRLDGAISSRVASFNQRVRHVESAGLIASLANRATPEFSIERDPQDKGILFHHRRTIEDGEILFLVNSSLEFESSGTIQAGSIRGIEQWDLATGQATGFRFISTGSKLRAQFQIPPAGSLLLFLSKSPVATAADDAASFTTVVPGDSVKISRLEPNVLTLDYVDVTAAGESRTNIYFYAANQFAFQKNGLPRNPWDSAVQYKDEFLQMKFPATSGFQATYRFQIAGPVPPSLEIVIERPDLYSITCNGKQVQPVPGKWWLDQAFGRIDLANSARPGENSVTISAAPFTIFHEIESAYLIGDFALAAGPAGFLVIPAKPLALGKWNEQGLPFYANKVAYRRRYTLDKLDGRHVVALSAWQGSVAKVIVNGKPAGYILARPWECDVTGLLQPGANEIEVDVIGTLKNTLGPHHGNPGLGSAWPGMFQKGPAHAPPGNQYATVGYGLFEPLALKRSGEVPPDSSPARR